MIYVYIALALFLIVLLFGHFIAKSIFKPRKYGYEQTFDIEVDSKYINKDEYDTMNREEIYEYSGKLKLHAHYINNDSDKTIIIMHGHTYTLFGSYKYANYFLRLGYNVLMPDQRYHGLSDGKNCTLGYKEKDDLEMWIEYIMKRNPHNQVLGLHGESMGAATVLLGGHNQHVDFVISDCSFSDLKTETLDIVNGKFHLPKFLIYPTDWMSRLFFHAPLLHINPYKNIKNITAPILFIHGDSDKFINIKHFEKLLLFQKNSDSSYICEGADHAMSYHTNPERYEETVQAFLKELPF